MAYISFAAFCKICQLSGEETYSFLAEGALSFVMRSETPRQCVTE